MKNSTKYVNPLRIPAMKVHVAIIIKILGTTIYSYLITMWREGSPSALFMSL
jgi:hypothetical protein